MCQKVSVIVPVYNAEKYLNRCVDSIINSSFASTQIM
ncbi:glycosyltransferase [uncultured Bacteroides sp.]|nr:glycosyltransferase [uncultured Bacteroides sp.]